MKTQVAKFNVGGRRYEVAKSLLDSYPETILARSASKTWQEDPEEEIYIERDGERFAHCLDYLRDRKCKLLLTVNREAVLDDLKYYGVEDIDESAVMYAPSKDEQKLEAINCTLDMIKYLESNTADHQVVLLALRAIVNGETHVRYLKGTTYGDDDKDIKLCFNQAMTKEREAMFAKYGLKITKFSNCIKVERLLKTDLKKTES